MAQTPFPAGFKRPRRGFGSSFNPQDFLNQYLQGFTPIKTNADTTPSETSSGFQEIKPTTMMESSAGSSASGSVIGDIGDIGFGKTPEGKTILTSHGTYAGFMPRIEQRDGKFYVEDNRGYGPFKGKMHEVPEVAARHAARRASMGMTRYLMPHPNPEQFAYKTTIDGISGTMSPSYVTGGGTIWNPRFTPDQPGAPDPTRPGYRARQIAGARRAAIRGGR